MPRPNKRSRLSIVLRALLTVMGMIAGLVGAVLGALLLIWLWQAYIKR